MQEIAEVPLDLPFERKGRMRDERETKRQNEANLVQDPTLAPAEEPGTRPAGLDLTKTPVLRASCFKTWAAELLLDGSPARSPFLLLERPGEDPR